MPGGLHAPLSVMAAWPPPDYDHPETLGNGLMILSLILGVTATVLVLARLYTRVYVIRQPGADDVLIVVGLVFAILLSVSVIYADLKHWIGIHIWDFHLHEGPSLRFVSWLSEWAVILSSSATKSSILLFYLRLAPPKMKTHLPFSFRTLVILGLIYNILYALAFSLVLLVSCRPLHMYWDQYSVSNFTKHQDYHCASDAISLPCSGGLSVLADAYATVLPIFLLKGLRMPLKQKIALYALFGLGFLVVAAGVVRTIYIDRVESRTYDVTWAAWQMWLWTIIETYTAILCSCAPALKPLLIRYVPVPSLSLSIPMQSRSQLTNRSHRDSRKMSWASTTRKSRASFLGSPATVIPGNTPPLSPLSRTFRPGSSGKSVDLIDYCSSKKGTTLISIMNVDEEEAEEPFDVGWMRDLKRYKENFERSIASNSIASNSRPGTRASSVVSLNLGEVLPARGAWPMGEFGSEETREVGKQPDVGIGMAL